MSIQFNIQFITQWGQSIYLFLHTINAKGTSITHNYLMSYNDMGHWSVEIELNETSFTYQYSLCDTDNSFKYEHNGLREVHLNPSDKRKMVFFDYWRINLWDQPFTTTAFKNCFFKRSTPYQNNNYIHGNLVFKLNTTQLETDQHIAIIGNQKALGNWDINKKIRLNEPGFPFYTLHFNAHDFNYPLEYKYVLVNTKTDEVIYIENRPNRILSYVEPINVTIIQDENFNRPITTWKTAGVSIPVFSLRSESGFGIGEFLDLRKMVNWAKETGQHIIQILPINDTTLHHSNSDSYPYSSVSVYALHPIYLRLEEIGKVKAEKQKKYFQDKKILLNANPFLDYYNVMMTKWEYFEIVYPIESPQVFESKSYKEFFENNKEWLVPYAAFSYLRDINKTPNFNDWKKHSTYNAREIEKLCSPTQAHYHKIAIHYFLQYHLHLQLADAHEYATSNGIAIKGDIPIGVSPFSVDTWVEPELFNLHLQTGAPPDDFSATGQNWGFPTYNWNLMEKDGYHWWKKRFKKMAEYFDAYRIDHILGFFRIWGIPITDVWGLTGVFQPSLPFSKEELQSRGIWWDEQRFLKPYLKEHILYATFGEFTDEVISDFFLPDGWQNFKFKPEFDTQRKIEKYFASTEHHYTNNEILIRDGLYMLQSEVLFIRDEYDAEKFHPRIAMQNSATFGDLPEDMRSLIENVYVDYFYHRHNNYWKEQAYKKLPALISATNMLVCGEDLGMVPDSVPDVMNQLEILSLEIQRMPKNPFTEFGMPADAPYRSVCSTSTHDMNPLRAWWLEDSILTQRFYNTALHLVGKAPETCEPWIVNQIIKQHLYADAMMVVLPWQDWMALEPTLCLKDPLAERINVPSNPQNFWRYRMHLTLEQLLDETKFNNKIKQMIAEARR